MKGAVATTPGVLRNFTVSSRQLRITSSVLTRMCASKSITFCCSSRSNPVMTEMTRMSTVTPSVTPDHGDERDDGKEGALRFEIAKREKKTERQFQIAATVAAISELFQKRFAIRSFGMPLAISPGR